MNLTDAISAFLAHCEHNRGSAPGTLDSYTRALRDWQRWHQASGRPASLQHIAIDDIRAYLQHCRQRQRFEGSAYHERAGRVGGKLSQHALAAIHRCLRNFWHYCGDEKLLTIEQEAYFRSGRIPAPKTQQQARPTYDTDNFEALLAACERANPELKWRDRSILLLLRESGMRVSELCSLTDKQVDLAECRAAIIGKGGKPGYVFWGKRGAVALKAYLHHRSGPEGGPLFRGVGTKNMGGALSPVAIRRLFRRLARRAGVDLPPGAPVHAVRHTFAHAALEDGLDVSQVSQLLRHSSLSTTMTYVRTSADELQRLHQRVMNQRRG
jgi:integrase/recombinase XerD